jgi:hypothetical protein
MTPLGYLLSLLSELRALKRSMLELFTNGIVVQSVAPGPDGGVYARTVITAGGTCFVFARRDLINDAELWDRHYAEIRAQLAPLSRKWPEAVVVDWITKFACLYPVVWKTTIAIFNSRGSSLAQWQSWFLVLEPSIKLSLLLLALQWLVKLGLRKLLLRFV